MASPKRVLRFLGKRSEWPENLIEALLLLKIISSTYPLAVRSRIRRSALNCRSSNCSSHSPPWAELGNRNMELLSPSALQSGLASKSSQNKLSETATETLSAADIIQQILNAKSIISESLDQNSVQSSTAIYSADCDGL